MQQGWFRRELEVFIMGFPNPKNGSSAPASAAINVHECSWPGDLSLQEVCDREAKP